MEINLDKIIEECINNVLFEATISNKDNDIINNSQKKIRDHLKDKLKKGDKKTIDLMKSMGYIDDYDNKEARTARENAYNGELNKEVKEITNILKQYILPDGIINLDKLKKDYASNYDYIIRMKNFLDMKGLTYLYDKSANKPYYSYGINWQNGDDENNFDFTKSTDTEVNRFRKDKVWTDDETRSRMKKSVVDRYMDAKYGLKLDIPDISLSIGNNKLPKSTLIINFTSALNCPAWNECLVKHACYARGSEKITPDTFRANENRSLYWLSTKDDPKLLSLMMDFVRAYCFKYNEIADYLIKNQIVKGNNSNLASKISRLPLNDKFFTPEIIDVMKKFKRIENIRLNENGDFVGEWLVNAWDIEAGKYKDYDINVSAYTCRHFNFEGIKNIILNVSYVGGKGNIARHFIALPQNIYDKLDETYGGKNNKLIFGTKNIKPNPQPLYTPTKDKNGNIVTVPNGKFYYKCPCGRKKNENDEKKINCYQCNLCYQPKSSDEDFYVFVAAHGGAKANLNGYDLVKSNIGVSKNFFNNPESKQLLKTENNPLLPNKLKLAETNGIKNITNNAINSLYDHFNNINKITWL